MTQRTDRIDALLREEIGTILAKDVDDPAIGFTTITDVETVPDLSHAQVWVSQIGQPDERAASLAALRRAMPYVRRLLGQRLHLRRIPELHLRLDETAERGTRVLKLLAELESGATPDDVVAAPDPLPTPTPHVPIPEAPASRPRRGAAPRGGPRRSGSQRSGSRRSGPRRPGTKR
jgi:ribosome-binding factor A